MATTRPETRLRLAFYGDDFTGSSDALEVLAFARLDSQLQDELAGIDEAPEDEVSHPTLAGGLLPESWSWPRRP